MDYKFLIYPSSEKEMMAVKDEAKAKAIKIIQAKKLKELYKAQFGPAVKKFNDTALAGKMVDDYYESILASNIPEVYCISIIVRYDLASKVESQIIDKSFTDFKKELDKLKNIALSYVYWLSQDEFKEIQIYFVPISSGYSMGLSVKNDLIDMIRKEKNIKDNLNIIKAMPLVTEYFENIWAKASDDKIITEEELEKRARDYQPEDPLLLHSIEVGQLKENMNKLNLLVNSNQILIDQVNAEKNRIQGDLDWIAATEPKICKAEADRIAEEKRKIDEENRRKEEARLAELRRKEELRKAEEARVLEAERLTEQARRNVALRSMLSKQIGAIDEDAAEQSATKPIITQEEFEARLDSHLQWVVENRINSSTEFNKLSTEVLSDPRRLNLENVIVEGLHSGDENDIICASFKNIIFNNCELIFNLIGCDIYKLVFNNSTINNSKIEKSTVRNITYEQGTIDSISLESSTILDSNFSYSDIINVTSAPAVSYVNVMFNKTKFSDCDMKRNAFMRCGFESATFNACDMRSSTFQRCNIDNVNKINSLFNGTGI